MNESGHAISAKPKTRLSSEILIPLLLVAACIILLAGIALARGASPLKPSVYNSYTRQAMQWRKGTIALDEDVSYLELAVYEGEYYVSFPPVPTVPVFLLTFIFGENVPDTLLVQLYGVLSCLLVYVALKRQYGNPVHAAIWAFLICFTSSMLPLLDDGAVWFQAQMLAFLLTVAAIERTQKGKMTPALILFALSVGCRPFNILYGPLLIAYGIHRHMRGLKIKQIVGELLPGVLIGLSIAALYMLYNYIRFDNLLEFGHSYLPEFSTQGGAQFALWHIPIQIRTFIWGLPFTQSAEGLVFSQFGFSLFLASPIFICFVLWGILDAVKRRVSLLTAAVFAVWALHTLLLLSHRTVGGFQYGARYFVDCIPYVLLYLLLRRQRFYAVAPTSPVIPQTRWVEYALLAAGLVHNIIGASLFFL